MPVFTLREVLDKYLPQGQTIDFLNIDAEGRDLNVLESNDWSRYRPRVIIVEDGLDLESALTSLVAVLLKREGYVPVCRTITSVIWKIKTF